MFKKQRNVLLISLGIALAIFVCAATIILVKVKTKKDEPIVTDDGSLKYVAMLDFELNSDESGYLISGKDTAVGDIIMPRTYNGKPVVGIADNAFYENTELTGVTILQGSNMSIGDSAFYKCTNLTRVTMSDSVTSIGGCAFACCSSLANLRMSNSVTDMGYRTFEYCTSLTSITIPDGVKDIGIDLFFGCTSLTSVKIPKSVVYIDPWVFYNCSSLTKLEVDLANTKYHSAGNCIIETATKTLIVGCKASVIPDDGSVTIIGNKAFMYAAGLTSITIPMGITSIGSQAFQCCTSLTSVTIPGSVTSIDYYAFEDCTNLTSVIFENPNGWVSSGTTLGTTDLSDPVAAAEYLTSVQQFDSLTRS